MSDLQTLFRDHLQIRRESATVALSLTGFEALVISSGAPYTYFADDRDAPFQPTPHFAHWCPLKGPHHLLRIQPNQKPLLIRYAPEDFWYEQAPLGDPFWLECFDLQEAGTIEEAWKRLGKLDRGAYIGNEAERAQTSGLEVNPKNLTAHLDWTRSFKTPYEIRCMEEATEAGARGHRAAMKAFLSGASELEIHHAYVEVVGAVDRELPYNTIIALNEKGAILHYEGKRKEGHGNVLLIDAGASIRGYASDITRTHAAPSCNVLFVELLKGMEKIQQELCAAVKPGLPYGDLHHQAHIKIAGLLKSHELLHAEPEEAVEKGFSRPFFPHGLGHHLGIQVHDVAGRQLGPDGTPMPPPPEHPYLRTTRMIEEGQVFTVEPGLYFIPMLLRPFREGKHTKRFNWKLIDELMPCGGIRIEDNVLVTGTGHRNITREHLSN